LSLFFGWFIVAAAVVLTGYNSAMFVYGLTAFMTPIAATSGWTYTQISLATSIRGLQIGMLDPVAGFVVDRWPARRLMLLGTVVFAAGIVIVSRSSNLALFYVGFLTAGLGSAFCHNMVPMTVIARWFRKNIGKATGILYSGFSLGGLFVPLIVKAIDAYGWQDVMLYMAFGALVLGVPLSLMFRNKPEDQGLLPDGEVSTGTTETRISDFGLTLREVVRTRAFWIIGIAGTLQITAVHAVTVHAVPSLTSTGFDRSEAAIGVTIFSLAGIPMRIVYGVLADMFDKKYVYALSNGITTVSLLIFGLLDGNSFAMMALFGVVYGLGVSGAMCVRVPLTREYFGVKSFGAIYGMLSIFTVIGGVAGAPIAAWVYDSSGTYFPIWYIYAGLTAAGMLLLLLLPGGDTYRPGNSTKQYQ
jgi:MFS family permease